MRITQTIEVVVDVDYNCDTTEVIFIDLQDWSEISRRTYSTALSEDKINGLLAYLRRAATKYIRRQEFIEDYLM